MDNLCKAIQEQITSELMEKSPLRKEFEVVQLNGRRLLPLIPCKDRAVAIVEGGVSAELKPVQRRGRRVVSVPLFEIAYNPEEDADTVKGMSKKEFVRTFTKGCGILKGEKDIWKRLKKVAKSGKGYFIIRKNPVVLEAHDPKNNKIGYSIFEQIGVAVAN